MKFMHSPANIPTHWNQKEREYAQQLDALFDDVDNAMTKATTVPTVKGDDGKTYEIHVDHDGKLYVKGR